MKIKNPATCSRIVVSSGSLAFVMCETLVLIRLKRGSLAMSWIPVLYLTCGVGCGGPVSVALPLVNVWLSPNANPTQTVASFTGNYITRSQ
jgi:hypothetical protein